MPFAEQAPEPILDPANQVRWGNVVGLLIIAAVLLIGTWILIRYVRESRAIAEKALQQSEEFAPGAGETGTGQRRQ